MRDALTSNRYNAYKKIYEQGYCPFCDKENPGEIIEKSTHCFVRKNDFPYEFWDGDPVAEHLLLIPIREVSSIEEFTEDEMHDFFYLWKKYDAKSYSFYQASPGDFRRSVKHQHAHLIKLLKK